MTQMPSPLVDWDLAVSVAARAAGLGPAVSTEQAAAVVTELRDGADRSTPLVRDFTGLQAGARTAPVLVVDRRGWLQANVDSFSRILSPLIDRMAERKGQPSARALAIGSKVTGAEIGLMLGFLSTKVLGQFDPFYNAPDAHGRLLLVAPNVVHIEHELGVDPHDFRLWVCLHEETHRVQFTAVPWLGDHLHGLMQQIVGQVETDPAKLLGDATKRLADLVRGNSQGSLIETFSSPEQKRLIDQVTGVMSLLEGHADVVMDGVGPEVIPSVAEIRARFTERRQGVGVLDRLLRRLLGLDQKMAQYRDGAVFVRALVEELGMPGFNAVWERPENLPSKAEILDPRIWIARVHG